MTFSAKSNKTKILTSITYFIVILAIIGFLWVGIRIFKIDQFIEGIELRTLDLRFTLPIQARQHNENIAILAIDDNSLEILSDELGRWPWGRDVHAKVAQTLVDSGAKAVIFDLMFLGHQKGFEFADKALVNVVSNSKKVYLAMNFDRREESNDFKTISAIERLAIKTTNNSQIDMTDITFTNCRAIIPELLNATDKIGMINHSRDEDSISRRNALLFKYHEKYYPYLALKVAIDILSQRQGKPINSLTLTKDNYLVIGNTKVPLQNDGKMLVNWYGASQTFEYIPIWKVIKSISQIKNGEPPVLDLKETFKDKVILVGATASSLFDIKTTPFSKVHPGVEFQATVLNNVISGDFLTRAPWFINFLICVLLFFITGIAVLKIRSGLVTLSITISIIFAYLIVSTLIFQYMFVWLDIVYPMLVIAATFTIMYVIKYIMKSRDFEYTYKLATTDGLTGLHNHRFFQERMVNNIDRCRRYGTNFSLLLIDIDFFKKFNDNYGHQAGDTVLKQVADTLKKSVRSSDLVARYGGEEMAIVLDDAGLDEAMLIANKVCKMVGNRPFRLSETVEKHVTISLGVSTFPIHGDTPSAMIEYADKCLYWAKEHGRNQVGILQDEDELEETAKETTGETKEETPAIENQNESLQPETSQDPPEKDESSQDKVSTTE